MVSGNFYACHEVGLPQRDLRKQVFCVKVVLRWRVKPNEQTRAKVTLLRNRGRHRFRFTVFADASFAVDQSW